MNSNFKPTASGKLSVPAVQDVVPNFVFDPDEVYITTREAMHLFKVSRSTIVRMRQMQKLPFIKTSGNVYIPKNMTLKLLFEYSLASIRPKNSSNP